MVATCLSDQSILFSEAAYSSTDYTCARYLVNTACSPDDAAVPRGTADNPLFDAVSPASASREPSPVVAPLTLQSERQQANPTAPDAAATEAGSTEVSAWPVTRTAAAQAAVTAGQSHSQLVEACFSSAQNACDETIAGGEAALQQGSLLPGGAAGTMPPSPARQRHTTGAGRLPWPHVTAAIKRERAAAAAAAADPAAAAAVASGEDPPPQVVASSPRVVASLPQSPVAAPTMASMPGAGCLRTSPGGLSDSVCSSRCVRASMRPHCPCRESLGIKARMCCAMV